MNKFLALSLDLWNCCGDTLGDGKWPGVSWKYIADNSERVHEGWLNIRWHVLCKCVIENNRANKATKEDFVTN